MKSFHRMFALSLFILWQRVYHSVSGKRQIVPRRMLLPALQLMEKTHLLEQMEPEYIFSTNSGVNWNSVNNGLTTCM